MKEFFVVGLTVLFLVGILAFAVWRGFKKPSSGGCSCGCDTGNSSCSGCGTVKK